MFYLVPVPKQFVDFSGVPYSGGSVTVYVHGTPDKAQIYAEAGSSVLLHNPCQLDSDGAWKCFVPADTPLDYIVQDRDGNVVASYMNIVMPMIDTAVTKGYVDSQDQLRDKNFAADYDPDQAYRIVGTYVMNEGRLYKSAVVIDEPEEWNADHWTECTVTDELDAKIAAETTRATEAEAAAKTVVTAGENCSVTKTTAADGHDVYTVDADGKPQIPADWEQQDSGKPDYIKNKPNLGLKADKVQGATAGNLAALDANGNLADSDKKTADFKTKQTAVSVTGGTLKGVESMSQNANGEVTLTLNDIQDGTTAQKGVVQLNNAINSTSTTEAATPKAVKDAYDDLNNKIVARAVFLSQAEWAVQSQIPGDPAKVYYVENGTGEDAYTVYVWKESTSEYVEVDESSIDLDGYWHDSPTTSGSGNVVTDISLGNDGVPQVVKGITALTQHQSVTDNNPTLAWGSTSTVGTVGGTSLQVTMPSNPASGKLDNTGDASNTTATFTKASGDTSSMESDGKLSAIFTAISSFFASLKALAFKDNVSDSDISGTISNSHIASASAWNNKTNSVTLTNAAFGYTLLFTVAISNSNSYKGTTTFRVHTSLDMLRPTILYGRIGANSSGFSTMYYRAGINENRFKLCYKVVNNSTEVWLVDTLVSGSAERRTAVEFIEIQGQITVGNNSSQTDPTGLTDFAVAYLKDVHIDASSVDSGQFPTARIADDAITADKVKDNETLPVDVSGTAKHLSAYGSINTWASGSYNSAKPFACIAEITFNASSHGGDGSLLQFELGNSILVKLKLNFITNSGSVTDSMVLVLDTTQALTWIKDNIKISYFTYTSNNIVFAAIRAYVKFTNDWQVWRVRQLDCQTGDVGYTNWRPWTFYNTIGSEQASYVGTLATYVFTTPHASTSKGSISTPSYVDSDGQVQPCNPSLMTVGNATKWDGHAISVGTVVSSSGTISIA